MHSATTPEPAAPGPLGRSHRLLARIENGMTDAAGVAIFVLMLLTMAEVLGRRLFNAPVPGAIDMIEVGMVTFAFLGIAACQREGGHVRMDLLLQRLPKRPTWLLEAAATIVALAYVGMICVHSFEHFLRAWQIGDSTIDTQLPIWPSKLLVPVCLAVLELRLLIQLAGYLRLIGRPDAAPVAVPAIKDTATVASEEIENVMARLDGRPDKG